MQRSAQVDLRWKLRQPDRAAWRLGKAEVRLCGVAAVAIVACMGALLFAVAP